MTRLAKPTGEESAPALGARRLVRELRAALPAVRLVWIFLFALGAYGVYFLGGGTGVASLVVLPLVAVLTELAFDRLRFGSVRFPDAAIATGLFVALILPPTVSLVVGGTVAVAAIAVKHTLRYRGRPWFNPALVAVLLAVVLFGASAAWWGTISQWLVLGLGVALLLWNTRNWRLPVAFLATYAGLAVLQRLVFSVASGGAIPPEVLLLTVVDPVILFFGLFMVAEPRTAPSDPRMQPVYSVVVGAGAALLPLVLPNLAALVALLLGNLLAVGLRFLARPGASASRARADTVQRSRTGARGRSSGAGARWTLGRRVAAGVGVFLVVGIVAAASVHTGASTPPIVPPASSGGGGGGGGSGSGGGGVAAGSCRADNSSIPSSTLTSLHRLLGPSTILQYYANSGVVVFYDPVNGVTVTETDLYEDFGYAEFNGDDQAVAGCAP